MKRSIRARGMGVSSTFDGSLQIAKKETYGPGDEMGGWWRGDAKDAEVYPWDSWENNPKRTPRCLRPR